MLSDDPVEYGACLARNSLFTLVLHIQIILIGKHARSMKLYETLGIAFAKLISHEPRFYITHSTMIDSEHITSQSAFNTCLRAAGVRHRSHYRFGMHMLDTCHSCAKYVNGSVYVL